MIGMRIQCCKETDECIKRDCPTYREMVDRPLMLDESDPDERAMMRGVVSSGRAVLDGMRGAPRVREDDEQLHKQRERGALLSKEMGEKRISGVEELILLVRYLPESFMTTYLQLIDCAVGERNLGSGRGAGTEGSGREYGTRSGVQTKSEQAGYRGGAKRSGKSSDGVSLPYQVKGQDLKTKVDKRLRQIAREMRNVLSDGSDVSVTRRRCSGRCKRLGDVEWLYCPNCGGPMSDVLKS